MNEFRWLFSASALFGLAQVVRIALQFALAVFLTRALTPDGYGMFTNFVALCTFVFPFACLKPDVAVARAWSSRDRIAAADYVGTSLWVILATSFMAALLLVLFRSPIGAVSHLPFDAMALTIPYSLGYGMLMICLAVFQMQKSVIVHGVVRTVEGLVTFLAIIGLVTFTGAQWRAAAAGQAAGMMLLGMLVCGVLIRNGSIRLRFQTAAARDFVTVSLPLVPHYLGAALIGLVDRFFITAHFGPAAAGTYAVAYQVSVTIWLFGNVFQQAWMPWVFDRLNIGTPSALAAVRTGLAMAVGAIGLVSFAVALATPPFVVSLFGNAHAAAADYIPLMCAGFFFSALQLMVNTLMYHRRRTGLVAWSAVAGGLLNIVLNAVLVPYMGPQGAACAMLGSAFVSCLIVTAFWLKPVPKVRAA